MLRICVALFIAAVMATACPKMASSAELKGIIKLPAEFKPQKVFNPPLYWKLPNDVLEIRPPIVDPRMEMVVILKGGGLPVKSNVKPLIRMEDSRFIPPVLPARANDKITFQNDDWTLHNLEPIKERFMKAKRIGPAAKFDHSFEKPGTYRLRCSEFPHMVVTIFVTDAPQLTLPNGVGAFKFDGIPPGSYTLRIWYHGDWIHTVPVAVKGQTRIEIQLQPQKSKSED